MRRLAWTMAGFSGVIFAAHYLLPEGMRRWAILLLLVLFPLCWLLPRAPGRRARLLAAGAAAGIIWYTLCAGWIIAPIRAVPTDEITVSARVTGFPTRYDHAVGVTVRVTEPRLTRLKTRLYAYDGSFDALQPGDEITLRVKLRPGTMQYGEETDTYLSRGVGLIGTVKSAPVVTGQWRYRALYAPTVLAQRLKEAVGAIFPADTASFALALMLGEKQALYAELLDIPLKNAGIMHAVAVSGMHLSFLVGLFRLPFGRRRGWSLAALPLIALFALMAGATPSVLRAAFMTALLLFAPVLGRENDMPTTLLTALGVLLLANPFSAGSVSLQLSFASLAGICLLSGRVDGWLRVRMPGARLWRYVRRTLSTTVGASVFTAPLGAVHFGTVSLLAPVTNLLVLWVLPAAFAGCWAAALAGWLWLPLGRAIAWLTAWPLRYVLLCAEGVSAVPGMIWPAQNTLTVLWLLAVYLLLGLTWRLSPHGKFRPAIPVCCCVMMLCIAAVLTRVSADGAARVTALDVGQGQCIFFRDGNASLMVDCGGNHTTVNAGDTAAQALLSEGRASLGALVLTHPHEDHVNGARRLLRQIRVGALVLPAAADAFSEPIASLIETAERRGTTVYRLSEDTAMDLGALHLELYVSLGVPYEDGCLMLRVTDGDFDTLITGDVDQSVEQQLAAMYDLEGTELFIAGHHGSKRSSGDVLLQELGAAGAIISCGYNNYGHPAPEAMARLSEHGMKIYRTDVMGSITIRME